MAIPAFHLSLGRRGGILFVFVMGLPGCATRGSDPGRSTLPGGVPAEVSATRTERSEPRDPGLSSRALAPVTRFEIEVPDERLFVGTSIRLRALVQREGTPAPAPVEASWSSRNPEIASVTTRGILRGHRLGRAALWAEVEGRTAVLVVEVSANPVVQVEVRPGGGAVRVGDVLRFQAVARDSDGQEVARAPVLWSIGGGGPLGGAGGAVDDDGVFVAEREGEFRVVATVGSVAGEATVEVRPRNGPLRR